MGSDTDLTDHTADSEKDLTYHWGYSGKAWLTAQWIRHGFNWSIKKSDKSLTGQQVYSDKGLADQTVDWQVK